ncbi:hypothetical protein J2X72_004319 [Phyllobacterium sp. 1468]|nr:hypothetical protein [Phyllobacterium sp. 1468]
MSAVPGFVGQRVPAPRRKFGSLAGIVIIKLSDLSLSLRSVSRCHFESILGAPWHPRAWRGLLKEGITSFSQQANEARTSGKLRSGGSSFFFC